MLSPVKVWKGEQVPLFKNVTTEISAQCNRSCVFCPNHDFDRPDQQMTWSIINKVLDELVELKYKGRWQPYMYNEPLKDPRLFDIVRKVRRRLPRVIINISTNCDYLTEETLDELIDAGCNQLTCNIYSARDGSENEEKVQRGIEIAEKRAKRVQSWLDARPHIDQNSSLYTGGHPDKIVAKVLHKYGVQPDGTNFGGAYKLTNRSGQVEWLKDDKPKKYSGTCTRPFRLMEIRWTGDVVLCCQDFNGIERYGNVSEQSLVEIWNNMKLHERREQLQRGVRKGKLCSTCDFAGGSYKHMIHPVQLERPERK